jgi:hypothetical protein
MLRGENSTYRPSMLASMEVEQAKVYHHHTPRQYLLPWADSDERTAWYGYSKVMRSGLTVVGGEDHFYRLKELTVPDIDCMKLFIDGLQEIGREGHRRFLQMYVLPTQLKRHLEERGNTSPEAMKQVDIVRSNLIEDYHASIERNFWPYLELIKSCHFDFLEDVPKAIEFFHGFAVQYMRTKTMKERALQKPNVLFDDVERVWDVLSHIMAVEMGRSFFMDRRNFQIVVLENETQVPFITSDQPIINIRSNAKSFSPPEKMEFYYPLSPTQAMLYLENTTPIAAISQSVSIDEAHRYNMMMLEHRAFRVFSDSEEYLTLLAL